MKCYKVRYCCIVLLILLLGVGFLSLQWGSYSISISDIMQVLLGNGSTMQNIAVFDLRLPRIVIGVLVGSALAVSCILLQRVTNNDLADPGIIGINAGASLGAVVYIFFQSTTYYTSLQGLSIFILPFVALIGACASAFLLYTISSRKKIRPQRLLLTGIGLNIAINALISFISFKGSSGDYQRVLVWTNGSLWGSNWQYVQAIAPLILLILILVIYKNKTLDVVALGDDVAISLGVNVQKQRNYYFFYAVILAACATAVAGNISFLGLLGAHMARSLVGYHHKHILPISMMVSSCIIIVADAISRNAFSPLEIPTGITISIIGVPYFIYLMMKEKV